MTKIRLQKYLATCNIGSRRTCETFITMGRICVDGVVITELGVKIDPEKEEVTFDGELMRPDGKKWILLNKPPQYLCTMKDAKNRALFLDLLPNDIGRLYPVGRLDYMSQGLLLVTNDGNLANKIAHPRYEIEKTYEVTTTRPINAEHIDKMRNGIHDKNELLTIQSISLIKKEEKKNTYRIILKEGRYRHIRRILKSLQIPIVRLKRTQIGPIVLGNIPLGKWRYLTKNEIELLRSVTSRKQE